VALPALSSCALSVRVYDVYGSCMKSRDLIRELEAAGWYCNRIRGSHHVFVHPYRPHIITVPHPKKDLGKGLVQALRKLAGLT